MTSPTFLSTISHKTSHKFPLKPVTLLLACTLSFGLSGCVNYAGINPQANIKTATDLHLSADKIIWPTQKAWEVLNDPVLNQLMEQALVQNPTINIAKARLEKVAALVRYADGNRYPEAGVLASVQPEHLTKNYIYPPPYAGSTYSTNLFMVEAKYEFDFWGKNRAALEAALSQQKAAAADIEAASLIIETSIARSYFTLGHALEQKKILEQSLKQRQQLALLTQQRLSAGLDTQQDFQQTKSTIPALRSDILKMDEQIHLARHAIAALIGQTPDSTQNLIATLPDKLNTAFPQSIPADLLGRRADIAAARARVEAANSGINEAKARFYPDINLTAFAGFSSLSRGLSHWLEADSHDYGINPAISLPIFDAGRLRANLSSKNADYDLAVESYNQTIVEAVKDVADQISMLKSIAQLQEQQTEQQKTAERIYYLAQQREKAGLVSQASVLNAQTAVLAQQSAALELRTQAIEYTVSLLRALGGGFNVQSAADRTKQDANSQK